MREPLGDQVRLPVLERSTDGGTARRSATPSPAGILAVSDDVDPDATEGSELTYLPGACCATHSGAVLYGRSGLEEVS